MGRYRRYLIPLTVVAALLGAYTAVGFLAVPHFARNAALEFVRAHYHRTLRLGEIHFNPFTLKLDVTGVALPDTDGQTMLGFERLHVDLQFASLWRLGPSFREIVLEKPYVRAVLRRDGEMNLADLAKGFPSEPKPRPQKPAAPPRLFIQRLAVIAGATTFEDRTHATAFRADFKPIEFELHDFSTRAQTADAYSLEAASPQGERLNWHGTVHLAPLASHGEFAITDLKARTVWSYLRESVPFEIDSGVLHINGDYDLAGSGGGPLGLKVNVRKTTVTSLGIKPKGGAQSPDAIARLPLLRGLAEHPHYVDIGRIEVTDTRLDLTRHSVSVAKVGLADGDLKVWIGEQGQLNLLELLSSGAAGTAPVAASPSAQGGGGSTVAVAAASNGNPPQWMITAPDIALEGFKVSVADLRVTPAATLSLSPLNVHVGGFNTSPDDTLAIRLDSQVNTSGTIDATAKVAPKSGVLSAHVEAVSLDLTALQPFIARYTSMTLLKGALSARLDLDRQVDGTLAVNGDTVVADLRTVDNALKMDFIKWKALRVADIRYRSSPASLQIGTVTVVEPYVPMIIAPDQTLNIKKILTAPGAAAKPNAAPTVAAAGAVTATSGDVSPDGATPGAAAPAAPAATADATAGSTQGTQRRVPRARQASPPPTPAAPAAPVTPFPMAIGTVRFVNGWVNYTDLWIKPSFSVGIQSLHGTITGLSSDPKSRAKVDLKGKVARYAPVHISGDLNLLSAALYTDITMSFKDLELPIVNPYSGHFVGYKIDKGKLSVDVTYKIEQRRLDAKQHFVIDQLELGDRVESPEAVHLPLKIAVALLKDRNGVIDLELPMNGSLDDPTFRVGPVIWKMFVNLIVKVATAPFALLGHLFGGGEHPNIIEFDAGSAELDPPARDQLAAVAKALTERPQLKLDVPIGYAAPIDRPRLAAVRLRRELQARVLATRAGRKQPDTAVQLVLSDPEKRFKLLLEQYRADLGKDAPLPASALAVQQAKRGAMPPYDAANADLKAALIAHIQVPDSDLEDLGKQRARSIQQALVSDGKVDPQRVFIVNAPPKPESGERVKVELALKTS
jgi:hypothetical protein